MGITGRRSGRGEAGAGHGAAARPRHRGRAAPRAHPGRPAGRRRRARRAGHRRRRPRARLPRRARRSPPSGSSPTRSAATAGAPRLYRTGDLGRYLPDGEVELPRPRRPPGQGARLPGRARARSRRRSAATRRCARRWSSPARTPATGGSSPTWCRAMAATGLAARAARVPARPAARLHGAGGVRRARRAAADAQRQGRPPGPARAASRPSAGRARGERAAHAGRGAARRDLGGPARRAASGSASHDDFFDLGGHSLLATRVVARRARGLRRRAAAARAVRGADRRRPGGAGRGRPPGERRPAPPLRSAARPARAGEAVELPASFGRSGSGSSTSSSPAARPTTCRWRCACAGTLDVARPRRARSPRSCAGTSRCAPPSAGASGRPGRSHRSSRRAAAGSPLPLVDLDGAARGDAARRGATGSPRPRPRGRSTSRAGRCSAPRCCASPRTSTCCCSCIHHIVSRRLVDRRAPRELGGALRGLRRAAEPSPLPPAARPVRRLRRLAAAAGSRARRWPSRSPTGASGSPARRRCSSCRPTGRARRCRAFRGGRRTSAAARRRSRPALRGARPRAGRDAVHGAARRLRGAALRATRASDDLVVGTPVAGRTRAEVEGLIGFFVNTLALRADLSGRAELPRARWRGCARPRSTPRPSGVPFERLLEELDRSGASRHTPLFQVLLQRPQLPGRRGAARGPEHGAPWGGGSGSSKFDLTLYVEERDGGLDCCARSTTPTSSTPPRMADARPARGPAAAGGRPRRNGAIDGCRLLTPRARRLPAGPRGAADRRAARAGRAVHELFARRARAPLRTAVALVRRGVSLDLRRARRGERPARRTSAAAGRRPGEVVAVCAERAARRWSWRSWACSGRRRVPDPRPRLPGAAPGLVPARRPGRGPPSCCAAAGEPPAGLAALPRRAAAPRQGAAGRRRLDRGAGRARPASRWAPDDLAYVAFTSGSTGEPKGIAGDAPAARPLPRLAGRDLRPRRRRPLQHALGPRRTTRCCATSSRRCGSAARSCVPDRRSCPTPGGSLGWMAERRVTRGPPDPRHGPAPPPADGAAAALPALRLRLLRRRRAHRPRRARLRRWRPGRRRSTSTAPPRRRRPWAGTCRRRAETDGPPRATTARVPVGRGIDGVQLLRARRVRARWPESASRARSPSRTPYLSRGYLGDPALTAERFVANPCDRHSRATGCTAPATSAATGPTGRWSSWAGRTSR